MNVNAERSDAELVEAALAGGPEAFAPIVRRYQDAVFGVALARLGNAHDAQDIAQQVLVEAFQRLPGLKDPARLGPWLRSITIHRCISLIRQQREAPIDDAMQHPPSQQPGPPEQVLQQELRRQVHDAIGRLGSAQRETTTLFYINGYTAEQVAGIQQVPLGTVKRRLHDARARLKEEMMHMVEDVLKSEAPKEDLSEKVYQILCVYRPRADASPGRGHVFAHVGWAQTIAELRRIGGQGLGGFIRALESQHSPTRVYAMHMLEHHNAPQDAETIVQLLVKGLSDPNRKVRRHAVEALLGGNQPEERKVREFVLLLIPMLSDASKRVRRAVAYELGNWSAHVPLATAAEALLRENDPETRKRLKGLVHAILHGGERKWYPA